uniref:Uncharacterized protein n=1 Tax=Anguilla anguilla TaxID=7936 RepID=A0A0E9W5S1_ANGAN
MFKKSAVRFSTFPGQTQPPKNTQ